MFIAISTVLNKNFVRILNIFFVLALIGLISIKKYYQHKDVNSLTELSVRLQTDLDLINEALRTRNFDILENNAYRIEIFQNDSIVYWNDKREIKNHSNLNIVFNSKIRNEQLVCDFVLLEDEELGLIKPTGDYIQEGISKYKTAVKSPDGYIKVLSATLPISKSAKSVSSYIQLGVLCIWLLGIIGLLSLWRSLILGLKEGEQRLIILFYLTGIGIFWAIFKLWINPFLLEEMTAYQVKYLNFFGKLSLIDLIADLVFVIYIILVTLHPYFVERLHRSNPTLRQILGASTTAIIFFFIFYQSKNFINLGHLDFAINSPLGGGLNELLFTIVLIGYCFINFYLVNLFFWNTSGPFTFAKKMLIYLVTIVVVCGMYFFSLDNIVLLTLAVFILIFLLSFDVFQDREYRHLSFFVWWVVFHSVFLTFSTYKGAIYSTIKNEKNKLEDSFYKLSQDDLSKIKITSYTLELSNLLKQLAYRSSDQFYDYFDFQSYIYSIIGSTKDGTVGNQKLTDIELFDQEGKNLFNNHSSDIEASREEINNSKLVGNNLYYKPTPPNFIWYKPITDSVHMILKFHNTELKPYSGNYLFFKDKKLIGGNGIDYIKSEIPDYISRDTSIYNYKFYTYSIDNTFQVASFIPEDGLLKPISLFSLIFILMLSFLGGLTVLNSLREFLPNEYGLRISEKNSLRLRLQLSVIGLIVFSFTVIGVITAVYFNNVNVQKNLEQFDQRSNALALDINLRTREVPTKTGAYFLILNEFDEINAIYGKRLALYNSEGQLASARNTGAYRSRLPQYVMKQIKSLNNNKDNLGVKSYNLTDDEVLIPMYKGNKDPFAYITFHKSTASSTGELKNYVGTLLNVYIFLFLLAIAISLGISNSITKPLIKLRESLSQFKLGKTYNKLSWASSDEIGDLIHEYNKLTEEINKSAEIIAKTEREMAWREMAKQVAHEIKNPLTPMKLSLQYLERAASSDPENAKKMIQKISGTLMEQINNLSHIANSFSNFAAMPKTVNEKIILNEVVEHVHDLFRKRDDMDVDLIEPMNEIYVFADRNHLVRILNNILKNAVQSIPEDKRGHIVLELTKEKDIAKIRVTDNGSGIAEEMKDKVFTPNFTTKSSGTGLGLAITANMLETMGGRIYFDSVQGEGTTFYLEIPLMRTDLLAENEVLLDEEL